MIFLKAISKFIFILFVLSIFLCKPSFAFSSSSPSTPAWYSIDYLHWWTQNSHIGVPLITQNNNPAALGLINEPGTAIIFGSGSHRNSFNFGGMSGARLTFGTWLCNSCLYGFELSGFALPESKRSFRASSVNGNIAVVNIPFFDIQDSAEDVLVDHHPNTATVRDIFQPWGVEINALYNAKNQVHRPLIILMGLRYLNINESLTSNDAILELPAFPNSVVNVLDSFSAKNNFWGFQVGARTHFDWCRLLFDMTGLIALGDNHQKLSISGQTNVDNETIIYPIGLFAEPTNIGSHNHHQWAIVPELRARVGYNICRDIFPFISYNAFYISNIVRPGKQIDRHINLTQNPAFGGTGVLTGPRVPHAKMHNSGVWMQGISLGIEINL